MAAAKKPQASAAAKAATAPAAAARFVRLNVIATRVGGKVLPIDTPLELGVDIPAALAEARVAAGTAEWVLSSEISAAALRDAAIAVLERGRAMADQLIARLKAANGAELLEAAQFGQAAPSEEDEAAIAALRRALDDHEAALAAAVGSDAVDPGADPGAS